MKFLLLIGFVFVVSLTHAEDTDVEQPEARAVSCSKSAQLDLQIIVDSSGSVGIKHFQQMMKDIADKVLSSFVIGPKHTRVALFKYSNLMVNEFDLDKFSDIKSLKTATAAVKYTGGGTKTGTAMKEALGHFTKKMRKDAKTAKVCIVFTDGESMDAKIIPGVTKEWAKAGVTVFAVGIGKGISKKGLVAVAGDAQHALQVNDFSELATSAKTLLVEVCKTIVKKIVKKIPKPTCFSYPAAKNVAYTSLKPLRSMDLGALTVDIYATLTQSTGDPCYVSYAIPGQNNELVLGSKGYVHINGALPIRRHTSIPALKRKVRYTVTWDGTSGVTVLYIDGKESARGTHKGKLRAGGSFVLGQEQDSVGGGFVSSQRFIGYLCDLQMWARVLSTAERQALFSGRAVSRGDVFDLPPTYTHALHAGALMV